MNYEDRVTKGCLEAALAAAGAKVSAGMYTGDGEETRTINLGFTPKAVLILPFNGELYKNTTNDRYYYGGIIGENQPLPDTGGNDGEYITNGGFVTMNQSFTTGPIQHWRRTNSPGFRYFYLTVG